MLCRYNSFFGFKVNNYLIFSKFFSEVVCLELLVGGGKKNEVQSSKTIF
ncbi:Putative protein [Zobellia galactanivorans]|uniref:Uncharacterized protein n=1 Tax=Zobellia galactanivorans (strain DSM 12802 / CCUG 47099 / CIP 106680 / NCIMB 13871 / Dsij) TaxID=63186 RepID=G0L2L8_ZOBGA|nr:Putative protein [Zobellia galactanivorans]